MKEGLKSAWMILLVLDLTVGLVGELLSSSVSDLLLPLKRVLELESGRRGGVEVEVLEVSVRVGLDLVVQSLLPLLTRRTMSLEETTFWGLESEGFLLSEETLDGGLLSSEVWSPPSPSLFSLWAQRQNRINARLIFNLGA